MNYQKIDPFGKKQSRGTFDDFFSTEKYQSIQDAYLVNDYAECDYVRGEDGLIYIEAKNMKHPEVKKYHKLNYQHFPFGIDALDDRLASEMACSML